MAKMISDSAQLLTCAKLMDDKVSSNFKAGTTAESKKMPVDKDYKSIVSSQKGKSEYNQVLEWFRKIKDNLELNQCDGYMRFYEHTKIEARHDELGESFCTFVELLGGVHKNILGNMDTSSAQVLGEWCQLANDINKAGSDSEITVGGTESITTTKLNNKGELELNVEYKKNGNPNIIDYLSNGKNGFKDAYKNFLKKEEFLLRRFYAELGETFDDEIKEQYMNSIDFRAIQRVGDVQTDQNIAIKLFVDIGLFVFGLGLAGAIAKIGSGILRTVATISSGSGLGLVKAYAYENLGTAGTTLSGYDVNYGRNMAIGGIEGSFAVGIGHIVTPGFSKFTNIVIQGTLALGAAGAYEEAVKRGETPPNLEDGDQDHVIPQPSTNHQVESVLQGEHVRLELVENEKGKMVYKVNKRQ